MEAMKSSKCLSDLQLQALLHADADHTEDDPKALQHIEDCVECRERLERLATGPRPVLTELKEAQWSSLPDRPDRLIQAILTGRGRDRSPPGPAQPDDWWRELLTPSSEPGVLGCLGGFHVLEVLGRGGMGLVLRGFDPQLRRQVAIKIPAKDLAASSDYRRQFLHEAQAAASLSHENVVAIFQVGQGGDCPYLVMELVEGGTLADRVRRGEPFSNAELYHLGREAAQGLAAAHQAGLVHGDLKPANILWDQEADRYKLADFGLARYVGRQECEVLAGTPAYMAPEQARGEAGDERSDLYSLGLILRDCATGFVPQIATSGDWTVDKLSRLNLVPLRQEAPQIDRRLADTIDALLRVDPDHRIGSAAALGAILRQRSVAARRAILAAMATSLLSIAAFGLAAEAMGWIDWVDAIGPEAPAPVSYPFQIEGSKGGFDDLGAAIDRAADGDRILVAEEGPHLISPIEIEGKSLEIVGSPGLKPVFVAQDVASDRPIPLLTTNANLLLRSLEFRYQVAAPRQLDERWDRCAIRVNSALVRLESCRFLMGRGNVGVGIEQGSLQCDRCEFMGNGAVGIRWLPGRQPSAQVSGTLFATVIGLAIESDGVDDSGEVPSLLLRQSIFRSERAIQLVFHVAAGPRPPAPLEFKTVENVFDSDHVLCLFPRNRRMVQELQPRAALRLLHRRLKWNAMGNLYLKGASLASIAGLRNRLQPIWDGGDSAERWRGEWGDGEAGTGSASFQFEGPATSVQPSDHRLRSVTMAEGEMPDWVRSLIAIQR